MIDRILTWYGRNVWQNSIELSILIWVLIIIAVSYLL